MTRPTTIVMALALILAGCGNGEPQGEAYLATLGELNGSGVDGVANLVLEGTTDLTVRVDASGLEPGEHLQHIHGSANRTSVCPTDEVDENGNGLIELSEGVEGYGPVVLDLSPYPTANEEGQIAYQETHTIDPELVGDLSERLVVIHGMTADLGEGESYQETLPVACGPIELTP